MVQTQYGKLHPDFTQTCSSCGYLSNLIDEFISLADGPLCHTCFDEVVYDNKDYMDKVLQEEETRKSQALAYAINTDYFE